MKESSNEMYISGDYLKNNPDWDMTESAWKVDVILQLMKRNGLAPAEVIETGCGAGAILAELEKKDQNIKHLRGYDISPQAIALAAQFASEKISYYNEDLATKEDISTDLMLIIDVVEHVDDFYDFLRNLKKKSQHFIFHIPMDLSCRTILKPHVLLQQRNAVGHIHYFTKETIEWALKDTGYEIIDWVYTKPIIDTDKPDSFKRAIKKILRNVSFAVNKNWSVKMWGGYSIMLLAK